jgi:hypothetical protein
MLQDGEFDSILRLYRQGDDLVELNMDDEIHLSSILLIISNGINYEL